MELLNEVEVAKILRVKVGTIQQWRSRGQGPKVTYTGDLPRYTRESIESYLEARTFPPGTRPPKPKVKAKAAKRSSKRLKALPGRNRLALKP